MSETVSYQMFIDGAWCDAADGATLESVNPATGEVWCRFPNAGAGDVDRAVKAALPISSPSRPTGSPRSKPAIPAS